MVEVKLVTMKELDVNYENCFTWETRESRDNYFDLKSGITFISNIMPTSSRDTLTVNYSKYQLHDADYLYYHDGYRRLYYFITAIDQITETTSQLYLKLDVWTTYQFDLNLNQAFVERCHMDRWNKKSPEYPYIWSDDEGFDTGEMRILYQDKISNMSDIVIYSSSVPIGRLGHEDGGSGIITGGMENDLWLSGKLSSKGYRFIKGFEGFAPRAYRDPGGYYTIGYGITKHGEKDIYNRLANKQPISEEEASKIGYDLKNSRYGMKILSAVKSMGVTKQHQFDALCSVAYNCGTGVITGSSKLKNAILRDINDEAYIRKVWENFYVTSNGQYLSGLKKRRIQECNMFFGKIYETRSISIINTSGKVSGTLKEKNGDGWLPSDKFINETVSDTHGHKMFNNAFGSDWLCPVKGATCTSVYGMRKHPITGKYKQHHGTDIGCPTGTPVRVSKSGKVTHAGWQNPNNHDEGYGLRIWVDHGTYKSCYPHLSKLNVKVGQTVNQGDLIGYVGSTGSSTGPHMHWEIRRKSDNQSTNPAPTLKKGDKV